MTDEIPRSTKDFIPENKIMNNQKSDQIII